MKITGKAKHVRAEFIRSWTQATLAILELHNLRLDSPQTEWTIRIKDLSKHYNHVTKEMGCGGYCSRSEREIAVSKTLKPDEMATVIIHEWIHAVEQWGDSNEKCCSTLTAKLKPIIAPIAEQLLEHYYRVKAYIAHTRPFMSYRVKEGEEDRYDKGQWVKTGAKDKYKDKEKERKRATVILLPGLAWKTK